MVIRADANTQMGTGHVMRCLALAQAWHDAGGHAMFVTDMKEPKLQARLRTEGIKVKYISAQPGSTEDAIQTVNLAQKEGATWIVVDGYHFGTDYQRIIKDSGSRLLFIDDNGHANHYYADIVLNQNIHAHEGLYTNREPCTQLLLGTRYVLLRREFVKWQGWKRKIQDVAHKVLVTMGGSDRDNVTIKVIQALQQVEMERLKAVVVVGVSNPHYKELQYTIQDSPLSIRLESNMTNMSGLMAWADVAIASAGSTSWELAFMGLPAVILVLAENQEEAAQQLMSENVFISLGYAHYTKVQDIALALKNLILNREIRHRLSQNGTLLVDGLGTSRIIEAMSGIQPKGMIL